MVFRFGIQGRCIFRENLFCGRVSFSITSPQRVFLEWQPTDSQYSQSKPPSGSSVSFIIKPFWPCINKHRRQQKSEMAWRKLVVISNGRQKGRKNVRNSLLFSSSCSKNKTFIPSGIICQYWSKTIDIFALLNWFLYPYIFQSSKVGKNQFGFTLPAVENITTRTPLNWMKKKEKKGMNTLVAALPNTGVIWYNYPQFSHINDMRLYDQHLSASQSCLKWISPKVTLSHIWMFLTLANHVTIYLEIISISS